MGDGGDKQGVPGGGGEAHLVGGGGNQMHVTEEPALVALGEKEIVEVGMCVVARREVWAMVEEGVGVHECELKSW